MVGSVMLFDVWSALELEEVGVIIAPMVIGREDITVVYSTDRVGRVVVLCGSWVLALRLMRGVAVLAAGRREDKYE